MRIGRITNALTIVGISAAGIGLVTLGISPTNASTTTAPAEPETASSAAKKLAAKKISKIASKQPNYSGSVWKTKTKTMRLYGVGPATDSLKKAMARIREGEKVRYTRTFYTKDQMFDASYKAALDDRVLTAGFNPEGYGISVGVGDESPKLKRSLDLSRSLGIKVAAKLEPVRFPQPPFGRSAALPLTKIRGVASKQRNHSGSDLAENSLTLFGVGPATTQLRNAMSRAPADTTVKYRMTYYTRTALMKGAKTIREDSRVRSVERSPLGRGLVVRTTDAKLLNSLTPRRLLGAPVAIRTLPPKG